MSLVMRDNCKPPSVARASTKSRLGRYERYLGIWVRLKNSLFAIEPWAPTRQNLTPSMICYLVICKRPARAKNSHA